MRPMERAVHFDFHTMPGIDDLGTELDPERLAAQLEQVGARYINMFAKCNIGFAYYPTEIGQIYPGLSSDLFGDVLEACHRRDIGVTAYVNVGLDHELARTRRDWCRQDKEGRVVFGDRTANFFRTMCPATGYGDHIIDLIAEIGSRYDIDGLFCDCMVPFPCYGDECLSAIKATGGDPLDDATVAAHAQQVWRSYSERIKETLGPDRYLYLNGLDQWQMRDLNTHIEIECLPSAWSFDFFAPHAAYARKITDHVLYMTGRFQKSWGDFGGLKTQASVEHDVADALAAGIGVSIGDHLHPRSGFEPRVADSVRAVYDQVRALEPWTTGARALTDVAVLVPSTHGRGLGDTYFGLGRMFGELRVSYDIVNETMDVSDYRLLVLPDELEWSDALGALIEAHLARGGRVLASGTAGAGPDGFQEGWPVTWRGEDAAIAGYFRADDLEPLAGMDWATYAAGADVAAAPGATVLARYVPAYFERSWDGFHGSFYTPPARPSEDRVAAAVNDQVAHLSFRVFEAYYDAASSAHRDVVAACLERLLPDPLVSSDLPDYARVTLTGHDDLALVHVKVSHPEPRGKLNIVGDAGRQPAGATVTVRGAYENVRTLPDESPLEATVTDGATTITLPEITGWLVVGMNASA